MFKKALDFADSILQQLLYDNDVLFLGDLNADPCQSGGQLATTGANKQGRILLRYLSKWYYASVDLHFSSSIYSRTHFSEAHGTYSTIDHILSSKHIPPTFL